MIEIRPITQVEGSEFLHLLCDVFGLDYERASAVFFNEPLYDPQRKWALFDSGKMASILTTVPLTFGVGRGIGIAGVATTIGRQNEGLAGLLLDHVLARSKTQGEPRALLFAKDERLYQRHGFEVLDEVVRGPLEGQGVGSDAILSLEEIKREYELWATRSDYRLRRDERRWAYWKWNLKVCTALSGGGYLCREGNLLREIVGEHRPSWKFDKDSEWLGLQSMADRLGLPLGKTESDLHLMGMGFDRCPEMFMTDQF